MATHRLEVGHRQSWVSSCCQALDRTNSRQPSRGVRNPWKAKSSVLAVSCSRSRRFYTGVGCLSRSTNRRTACQRKCAHPYLASRNGPADKLHRLPGHMHIFEHTLYVRRCLGGSQHTLFSTNWRRDTCVQRTVSCINRNISLIHKNAGARARLTQSGSGETVV